MKIDPDLIEIRKVQTSTFSFAHDLIYAGVNLGPASALSVIVPGDPAALEADVRRKLNAMSAHERLAFKRRIRGAS